MDNDGRNKRPGSTELPARLAPYRPARGRDLRIRPSADFEGREEFAPSRQQEPPILRSGSCSGPRDLLLNIFLIADLRLEILLSH